MLTVAELDRLAKDTGCRMHDDCLTCPLPECIYVTGRVGVIRDMARSMSKNEIAERLSISRKTVERALKER